MIHLVHLIQRRHPAHAGKLLVAIMALSAALMAIGIWMLLR